MSKEKEKIDLGAEKIVITSENKEVVRQECRDYGNYLKERSENTDTNLKERDARI
jgi:hypothetical protein